MTQSTQGCHRVPEFGASQGIGVDGLFEAVIDGRVLGWAYDYSVPDRRVSLMLEVDDEEIGRVIADGYRAGLEHADIGDGRHGFAVNLPARFCDGATHRIAIVLPTGEPLRVRHPFWVSVSEAALEWSDTSFIADGELIVPQTPAIPDLHPPTLRRTADPPGLRLRAADDSQFLRRNLSDGFSNASNPETIALGDHVMVERSEPLLFDVQPGVGDSQTERALRFAREGSYLARRPTVCRLPNAIVDTRSFLICPDEYQYFHGSFRHMSIMSRFDYSVLDDGSLMRNGADITEMDERVIVLGAQTHYNFSHWLFESLVRALLFRPLDDGKRVYLTPRLAPWQRSTLELIGLDSNRILEVTQPGLVRFSEVIAVSRGLGRIQEIMPAAANALASLAQESSSGRRLYVSRAHMRVRHASNEPELVDLLARHGFEVVYPEMLSIEEQIQMFASAESVVGLHGSGLTGVVFSSPDTLVIELQPEQITTGGIDFVWNLCAVRNHRFAQVVCRHAPTTKHLPIPHRDVTVDLPHLNRLLSSLLADDPVSA